MFDVKIQAAMLRLSEGKELVQFVEREQLRSLGLQRYTKKPKAQNFRLKKSLLANQLNEVYNVDDVNLAVTIYIDGLQVGTIQHVGDGCGKVVAVNDAVTVGVAGNGGGQQVLERGEVEVTEFH